LEIIGQFKDLFKQLIHLANTHLKYYQMVAMEQLVELFSKFIGVLILFLTSLVVWLFLSVWLSFAIGTALNSSGLGFLVMAGVNLLIGIVMYAFKTQLFINPFLVWVSSLFTTKEEGQNEH
jgi:hypothetical protein|tara:strand:+ start:695 stop:1057 length:363 start_codon:yes stop_codon:yes gene_type:complete